jgi:hypothetical protein
MRLHFPVLNCHRCDSFGAESQVRWTCPSCLGFVLCHHYQLLAHTYGILVIIQSV